MAFLDDWWAWLPFLEAVWVPLAAGYVILERRSATATIAWIFALALLPVLGVVVYLLVGPRRYDRRKKRRAAAVATLSAQRLVRGSQLAGPAEGDTASRVHLMRLAAKSAGPTAEVRSARLTLYHSGDALFTDLMEAVASARQHVHLEIYVWEPDVFGTALRDQLVARCREGVSVRVLVDGFGSGKAGLRFWEPLRAAGGQMCRFNTLSFPRFRPGLANFRTHRKIAVVDGHIGFVGGMNVWDVHLAAQVGADAWRDTHLRLEGEAVWGLEQIFLEDWFYARRESVTHRDLTANREPTAPAKFGGAEASGHLPHSGETRTSTMPAMFADVALQIVPSGPDENLDAIHKLFIAAIGSARTRVWLTTPYFVPDESLVTALTSAALAGVDVRVLVPARGDVPLVAAAGRSYYPELLVTGVRIFEFGPPVLHAKTLLVDDLVGVVGSANADNRSFRLNFEVVAACYDSRVCGALAVQFVADLGRAREISSAELRGLPLVERLAVSAARLLSPLL